MLSLVELNRAVAAAGERFAGLALDHVSCAGGRLVLRFGGRLAEHGRDDTTEAGADSATADAAVGTARVHAATARVHAGTARVHAGTARVRRRLVIVADRTGSRLGEIEDGPAPAVPAQPPFVQYLRAHLEGARLVSTTTLAGDRIAALRFEGREGARTLLLQILGPRSNLYLLDAADRIEASLRPLDETRRELVRGEPWRPPASGAPRAGEDRFAGVPNDALLCAIETHYASEREEGAAQEQRRRFATLLDRELRALARRLAGLREERQSAVSPDELARRGELLKSVLHRVPARATEVELEDPETGARITLPLDPRLAPAKSLAALFDESRRARRRAERAAEEEATLGARLVAAREQRERIDAIAADEAEESALAALAGEPPLRDLLRRAAPQPAPRARPPARRDRDALPARLRPKRYRSRDGLEIWVGRSDEGNDHLTLRLARGNDLFLHVEGGAGSHVVLRTEGRAEAPGESVLDACELAAHFSKQKDAARADVLVASIKDVSKPRGARIGLVHVRGGRTIHLRRDPARLAALLESRIEDDA